MSSSGLAVDKGLLGGVVESTDLHDRTFGRLKRLALGERRMESGASERSVESLTSGRELTAMNYDWAE